MFFENPGWLWAATSAIIPLILHLFELRRYKKVVFSDIRFLKQIEDKNRSQKRLKDLLILICRMLLLVAMAIAFAKPVLQPNQPNKTATKQVSLFVDNSYSMNAVSGSGPLIEVAKSKARAVVNAHGNQHQFQVLTNALAGAEQRWLSKEDALTAINEIKPVAFSASAQNIVARQKGLTPFSQSAVLYLISDFQNKQFNHLLTYQDTLTELICLPTIENQRNNIGIDTVYESYASNLSFAEKLLLVKVTNYGKETVSGISLNLHVNGTQKGLTNLTLAAGETQTKSFHVKFLDTEWSKGELSVTDYPIVYDDKLYFVIPPSNKIQVLEITNVNSPYFKKLFSQDNQFAFTQLAYNQIPYQDFAMYNLLIFNEPTDLTTGLTEQLKLFTEQGGQVLIVPNQKFMAGYLTTFSNQFGLPTYAALNNVPVKVGKVATNHPLYKNVFTKLGNNALLPTAKQYYSFNENSNTLGAPVVTLANGDPFLWHSPLKKGGLTLLATPLNTNYTDFQLNSIFVPTMLNLALNKQNRSGLYFNCEANTPIALPENNTEALNVIKLKGNKYEFSYEMIKRNNQQYFYPTQIPEAGFASVTNNKNNHLLMWCAFNTPRNESDLKHITDKLSGLKSNWKSLHINADTPEIIESTLKQSLNGIALWRWFVALGLLMAITEMALIKWMK